MPADMPADTAVNRGRHPLQVPGPSNVLEGCRRVGGGGRQRAFPGDRVVMVVHNETSTGVLSHIPPVHEALDRAEHPVLVSGRALAASAPASAPAATA